MLWWLLETTLVAAALAGAVALVCRRLRPRPAVRHALWLVVLLKLLAPPLLAWPAPGPIPLADEPSPRPPPVEVATSPPADERAPDEPDLIPVAPAAQAEFSSQDAMPEPGPPADDLGPTPVPQPTAIAIRPRDQRWDMALVTAWVAGAALMAMLQVVRIVRFHCQVSRGKPAPVALTDAVGELAARLAVRPPPVVVVPGLASPVVWGLGGPQLLWPAALIGRLSPDGQRTAIVHELAHLRRRDHWVGWLQLVAGCVWWWSPLYWHVRRQVGRAAELACDAWVIEVLPSARRAYAEALLEVCELVSRRAAPAPALGMGGARPEIERRLTMILRESVPSRLPVRALFGVVLLALIALPGLTTGQPGPDRARTADAAPKREGPVAFDFAFPVAKAPADEREQRLQKLEATLEALLKEVKDLRGASAKQPAADPTKAAPTQDRLIEHGYKVPVEIKYWAEKPAPAADQPIQLVRTTYKLPKAKADALAAVLSDLKAPVLEAQVKGDGIVITTTPGAQRVIGEFVGLLQGKVPTGPARSAYYPSSDHAPLAK
jgi:beta-lactamase regulating signal transducer with metallopeptidase domain